MQEDKDPDFHYFNCPRHPKHILNVVCTSQKCLPGQRFLCCKCVLESHSYCQDELISIDEFRELTARQQLEGSASVIIYSQYLKDLQVKKGEALSNIKRLRKKVNEALDSVERATVVYYEQFKGAHFEDFRAIGDLPRSQFNYSDFAEADPIIKSISEEVKSVRHKKSKEKQLQKKLKNILNRVQKRLVEDEKFIKQARDEFKRRLDQMGNEQKPNIPNRFRLSSAF